MACSGSVKARILELRQPTRTARSPRDCFSEPLRFLRDYLSVFPNVDGRSSSRLRMFGSCASALAKASLTPYWSGKAPWLANVREGRRVRGSLSWGEALVAEKLRRQITALIMPTSRVRVPPHHHEIKQSGATSAGGAA
jgi:hypothetical protein